MATVLIVDDARFMRMKIGEVLQTLGLEIVGEAENGQQAIQKYKELSPDLVTLDITMKDINGVETLKEIKKIDPNVTAIMCSAMGQSSYVKDAIRAGAKEYVVKPFNPERIKEAVDNAMLNT